MILPLSATSFPVVLQWLIQNSYPIMFLGMVIEGPTIIAAASFAVTMGYFNLYTIFILAVLGDVVGDIIAYSLGYFGRMAFIKKYSSKKIPESKMEKLKVLIAKHPWKIITAIKLSPIIPIPGLITVGSTHLSIKKFTTIILSIIIPKTILFMSLGYFLGNAYDQIYKFIDKGVYGILIVLIIAILIYYFYKKIAAKISKKLEES